MKRRIAGLAVWATFAAVVVVGCRKGSTPVEPLPPPTPSPSPAPTLSGAWIGLVGEDMGSTKIAPYDGGNLAAGNCTIRYDIEATLTQTAGTVSGPATAVNRVDCPEHGGTPDPGEVVRFTLSGTVSPPNTIVMDNFDERGQVPLTGTYTSTIIDVAGRGPHPNGGIRSYALRLRRK